MVEIVSGVFGLLVVEIGQFFDEVVGFLEGFGQLDVCEWIEYKEIDLEIVLIFNGGLKCVWIVCMLFVGVELVGMELFMFVDWIEFEILGFGVVCGCVGDVLLGKVFV